MIDYFNKAKSKLLIVLIICMVSFTTVLLLITVIAFLFKPDFQNSGTMAEVAGYLIRWGRLKIP